jgi:hypothetical protein
LAHQDLQFHFALPQIKSSLSRTPYVTISEIPRSKSGYEAME